MCKFNADLNELKYSTYISGSDGDAGMEITVDESGNAYITAYTESWDLPIVNGPYTSMKGMNDIYIAKLNADGSDILGSTFFGGSDGLYYDIAMDIVIDKDNNVCITGITMAGANFPTTEGAFQEDRIEGNYYYIGFVSKFDSSISTLLYSTFLCGDLVNPTKILIDSKNNIIIAGYNLWRNGIGIKFPTTNNAYDMVQNGIYDGFISRSSGCYSE